MKKAMHKIRQRPNQKLPREGQGTAADFKQIADWWHYGAEGFAHMPISRKDTEHGA